MEGTVPATARDGGQRPADLRKIFWKRKWRRRRPEDEGPEAVDPIIEGRDNFSIFGRFFCVFLSVGHIFQQRPKPMSFKTQTLSGLVLSSSSGDREKKSFYPSLRARRNRRIGYVFVTAFSVLRVRFFALRFP